MQSPQPPPTTATYTTIPISAGDVISRSMQNLMATVSRHRPWPEFVASGVFDRPDSVPSALDRARKNARYFLINYSLLVTVCGALFLIGAPVSLLIASAIFALWLLFYFFREDPLVLWGRHVSDHLLLVALALVSVFALWFTGCVESLMLGLGIGLLVCGIHAVFRSPDGLFLDEEEAVSRGLIGSGLPHDRR